MAMMDNRAFLVAHIRNSFITSDDTGMCELIIDVDDGTTGQHSRHTSGSGDRGEDEGVAGTEKRPATWSGAGSTVAKGDSEIHPADVELSHSMDILPDMDFAAHRRRSNTAQKLEKLKREKHKQSKIKHIQWQNSRLGSSVDELGEYFVKKDVSIPVKKQSRLSMQLTQGGKSNNPFLEYAKFNGKSTVGIATKKIDIFLTMTYGADRQYPMTVVTLVTARISDLIGLICWQYTEEDRQPPLDDSPYSYSLHIPEDDGEVDPDFPALDTQEPISKFGFAKLALVKKKTKSKPKRDKTTVVTVHIASRGVIECPVESMAIPMKQILEKCLQQRNVKSGIGPRYLLEKEKEVGVMVDLDQPLSMMNTLEFRMIREHSTRGGFEEEPVPPSLSAMAESLSSHQYKSYMVTLLHKLRTNADVQLGISGERIEIDPVSSKGKLFKQKAMTHDFEDIANCHMIEEKTSGKCIFRLVYYSSNQDYKNHDFETDIPSGKEIVQKVCNILEMRSSPIRKDYLAQHGKRSGFKKHLSMI